jgi:hypothetical protein
LLEILKELNKTESASMLSKSRAGFPRILACIVAVTLFILFGTNSYLIRFLNLHYFCPMCWTDKRVRLVHEKLSFIVAQANLTVPRVDPNQWIITGKLAHYSSNLILTRTNSHSLELTLETLVLIDRDDITEFDVKMNIKFLVLFNEKFSILNINRIFKRAIYTRKGLGRRDVWKLESRMSVELLNDDDNDEKSYSNLAFTIIDLADLKFLDHTVVSTTDAGRKVFLLNFHKPNIYDSGGLRKPAVAHCLHTVRHLESNAGHRRILDWLDLQKSIGIERVKMYFLNVSDQIEHSIRDHYLTHHTHHFQVDIVRFDLSFEAICQTQIDWFKDETIDFSIRNDLYQNCARMWNLYFDSSSEVLVNSMEFFCTNACYASFRYSYEYVTNYDFDEVIFPRRLQTNDLRTFEANRNCTMSHGNSTIYNMYEYISLLKASYDNDVLPIAAFHFENVAFFSNVSEQFLEELFSEIDVKTLANSNGSSSIKLKLTKDWSLVMSKRQHSTYVNSLFNVMDLISCLNRTIVAKGRLDLAWNRLFGILINSRYGKSVFNTRYTEFINQHFADSYQLGTRIFYVDLKDGFASHFRESSENWFANQVYSFSHLRVDLEFYYYLACHF